jgi:IstB-like ATP binding protein
MFIRVSRRYQRAPLIVTSNKPFSAWGEILGHEVTATAMIDRVVHHAEILSLKGRQLPAQRPRAGPPTPPPATERAFPDELAPEFDVSAPRLSHADRRSPGRGAGQLLRIARVGNS